MANIFTLFQIEKVGSDDREKTDPEATLRQQRLKAIYSARGDVGSESSRLAQQNLTPIIHRVPSHPVSSLSPPTPTLSEELQMKLTLSAQGVGRGVSRREAMELNQMRTSALLDQVRQTDTFAFLTSIGDGCLAN